MKTQEKMDIQGTWADLGLVLNSHGNPIPNLDNCERVLSRWEPLRGLCFYDSFHCKFMTKGASGSGPLREWRDDDDMKITIIFQRDLQLSNFPLELVRQGILTVARRLVRSEPLEWLQSLTWDEIERIEHFLEDHLGVEPTEYNRSVSKNFWLSLVARVVRPGCKVDTMIILEGPQGAKKSTALSAIASPAWHSEASESVNSKDFYQCLQGKWIIEIAELDSFSKADSTRIKQIVSCQSDRFRPPYGRAPQDFPRQCVFAGSTNECQYLRDITGGRRFWPVKVGDISIDGIRACRNQCFAEAYAKVLAGAEWWQMPANETQAEQERRRQGDPWEEIFKVWTEKNPRTELTTSEVLSDCFGVEVKDQNMANQKRAVSAMVGWKIAFPKINGKTVRRYRLHGEQS